MIAHIPRTLFMPSSAPYSDVLAQFRERAQLYARLTQPSTDTAAARPLAEQPLPAQIKLFERIAAGRTPRATADSALVQEVEVAVEQLLHALYAPADGVSPMIVPRDAWTASPIMRLLSEVTYWLYQDELIGVADATRVLYNVEGPASDSAIARVRYLLQTGQLRHYWKPGRAFHQRAVLVRRSDVERLKQEQRGG